MSDSAINFLSSFFSILWNFFIIVDMPGTNIPLIAFIVGPLALGILFGALDKLLGFGLPGGFSTINGIKSNSIRDSINADRRSTYAASRSANAAKESYFKNKK